VRSIPRILVLLHAISACLTGLAFGSVPALYVAAQWWSPRGRFGRGMDSLAERPGLALAFSAAALFGLMIAMTTFLAFWNPTPERRVRAAIAGTIHLLVWLTVAALLHRTPEWVVLPGVGVALAPYVVAPFPTMATIDSPRPRSSRVVF